MESNGVNHNGSASPQEAQGPIPVTPQPSLSAPYAHLGIYSDWVTAAGMPEPPLAPPGPETRQRVLEVLGMTGLPEEPRDVALGASWERDGVEGREVSWWVGYGPRTAAWLLKPAGARLPLPGVLALHDHGGFKFYGKEKIAAGPAAPDRLMRAYHDMYYGGRPFANALAREGFVVLVHDTFLWGSRRFPEETIPAPLRNIAAVYPISEREGPPDVPEEIARYNAATELHETVVEKYCALLGTTMAGVVSYEDRVALNYLASRPEVLPGALGCLGLSGGGNRSALLLATSDRIAAAHIAGMMSTYRGLLDHNVSSHTWMYFPPLWPRYGDWTDLTACRAPVPLLVQYDLDDALFSVEGMRAADARLRQHYQSVGHPDNYTGEFFPGPHKFDLPMQASALAWLKGHLQGQGVQGGHQQ